VAAHSLLPRFCSPFGSVKLANAICPSVADFPLYRCRRWCHRRWRKSPTIDLRYTVWLKVVVAKAAPYCVVPVKSRLKANGVVAPLVSGSDIAMGTVVAVVSIAPADVNVRVPTEPSGFAPATAVPSRVA